jgi:hypothetical protein
VELLLHAGDLLFMLGLFAVMLVGTILLNIALASRDRRKVKGRTPAAEGSNRAQRGVS